MRRAARKPEEAYGKAEQWAAERGIIHMTSEAFAEAYETFVKIMGEIISSSSSPVFESSGRAGPVSPNV